jgi:hypothetical protein
MPTNEKIEITENKNKGKKFFFFADLNIIDKIYIKNKVKKAPA